MAFLSSLSNIIQSAFRPQQQASSGTFDVRKVLNNAVNSALPPQMQQAVGVLDQAAAQNRDRLASLNKGPAEAAQQAPAEATQKPAYQDVSSPYGQTEIDAANEKATNATKGQSYQSITSPFASAAAYTQANASRTGQVLQNLYSGRSPLNATAGEAKLSAGLAAQGGPAFSEEKEKSLKDNAQKAHEATNPEAVAAKLTGNLGSVPQGVDLNYQIQSMIAPDVYAAEKMDRQARVNEALRTGQSDALAAENQSSLSNPDYKKGVQKYITDTAKSAYDAAKGTLANDKKAAEDTLSGAKAEATKSTNDAATIDAVNELERALGKKLTAAGGSTSPEYVAKLREDAFAEAKNLQKKTDSLVSKWKGSITKGADGLYRPRYAPGQLGFVNYPIGQLNADLQKLNTLRRLAQGSNAYSQYMNDSINAQNQAQSALDSVASQYGRFV